MEQAKILGAQTTTEQAAAIYDAILTTPEGCVLEVGSASGGTTYVMIKAAQLKNKHVYSVDPYPQEIEGKATHYNKGVTNTFKTNFKKNILSNKELNKDATQYNMYLKDCIDIIPEISVAFIDGCHEFEDVKNEFDLLYPSVVSGGRIFIHDIEWTKGQMSGSSEGAVANAIPLIKNPNFKNVIFYHNMISGEKI